MKKLLILLIVLTSCTVEKVDTNYNEYEQSLVFTKSKDIELQILDEINSYREVFGVNKLDTLNVIKAVANQHTQMMISNNKLSHNGFVERSDYLTYKINAKEVGEVVSFNYSTSIGILAAFLNSPSHKEVIEGDFNYFNTSVGYDVEGRMYVTVLFVKKS